MPPKASSQLPAASVTGADKADRDITILCQVMMACDAFQLNTNKLAPILGISHPKNVTQKINAIIEPRGFKLEWGKVVVVGAGGDSTTDAGPAVARPRRAGAKSRKPILKKLAAKKAAIMKAAGGAQKRKRAVDEAEEQDDGAEADISEA